MADEGFKGMSRLMRKLDRLGGNVQAAGNKATKQITLKAASDARRLAPSNKNPQSTSDGSAPLKNSITENFTDEDGMTVGHVVVANPHAAYVEFGTGQRGEGSPSPPKWDGPLSYREDWAGMEAQPYMVPAAEQNRDPYARAAEAALQEAIALTKGGV
jgi:HK97 gp10 family phage protein